MLKKTIALITFYIFMIGTLAVAHPGRLDKNGGHWNHKTKEYHYHKNGKVTVDKQKSSSYDKEAKKDSEKLTKKGKKRKGKKLEKNEKKRKDKKLKKGKKKGKTKKESKKKKRKAKSKDEKEEKENI